MPFTKAWPRLPLEPKTKSDIFIEIDQIKSLSARSRPLH